MSNQKEKTTAQAAGMNRAKPYQLVLFPMNNGATNVYYILTMNFIAYYANGVLGLALMFATTMVTVMRLFRTIVNRRWCFPGSDISSNHCCKYADRYRAGDPVKKGFRRSVYLEQSQNESA